MGSQSQIYDVDGVKMKFNKMAYRKYLESFCKEQRRKKQAVEDEIAKRTGLTPNAPHKWCYGESTPSKLEYVKVAAATLAISDFRSLLTTIEEGKEVEKLSDRQVNAVKRIYDECIWFLSEFNKTDGLNSFWQMYSDQELENPEAAITEMADSLHDRVVLVLDQEFFDLRDTDVYNELCEFVCDDLVNIYDGKLGYAYRFEAFPNGNPTLYEDYNNAMIKLNKIIEKYV